MRSFLLCLFAAVTLSGCYGTPSTTGTAPAETQARVENWEQQWDEARRDVTTARATAVASGTPIAPEVDAEVTELLERDLQSSDPEVRIEQLQDAVSDALRLAELVSAG